MCDSLTDPGGSCTAGREVEADGRSDHKINLQERTSLEREAQNNQTVTTMIMMKSVTTTTNLVLLLLLLPTTTTIVVVTGFSGVLFQDAVAQRRSTPSKTAGVDIELPDFNELFDRIQHVSPLARQVQQLQQQQRRSLSLTSSSNQQQRGFAHIAMNGEDGDPNCTFRHVLLPSNRIVA